MEKNFMEAMDFRHACKVFDETKKISDDDIKFILEVGRKSPSSFGLEGWKFLVITNKDLREKLKPFCWNQAQITSSSHLVVVLSAIDSLKPSSGIPSKMFSRREGTTKEKVDAYVNMYENHLKVNGVFNSDKSIYDWSSKQTYIALGNMMTAAATKKIDSCPLEGFEKENVEKILNLDTSKFQVACFVAFGYRLKEQSKQIRLPLEDIVEFIN